MTTTTMRPAVTEDPVHDKGGIWAPGFERWPWATFEMGVRLDAIERRVDALWAIIDWPDASDELRAEAKDELDRADRDSDAWSRDMDTAAAAYCSWP